MSALVARLGLAESRLAVLLVSGRGRVRGAWLGECRQRQQTRTTSWWKKNYDEGLGSNEFGLGSKGKGEEEDEEKKSREREESNKIFGGNRKGWGLDNQNADIIERRRTTQPIKQDSEELGWSQSSEDAFWDLTSRHVADDGKLPTREQYERDVQEATQRSQRDMDQSGWSQGSGNAYWEATTRSTLDKEPVRREQSRDPAWNVPEEDMRGADIWSESNKAHPDARLRRFSAKEWRSLSRRRDDQVSDDEEQSSDDRYLPRKAMLDIDYKSALPKALKDRDQDMVARCLYAAQANVDVEFIRSIPGNTFTQALKILEPSRMSTRTIFEIHADITKGMATDLGLTNVIQLGLEYGRMLHEIVVVRRRCGCALTEAHYLHLLKSAEYLGDWRLARSIWGYLHEDGVSPDSQLYNAYLAAYMRTGLNNLDRRTRLRVVDYNMGPLWERSKNVPRICFSGGTPKGVKEKAMSVLDAMIKSNVTANEETYRLIINAAAREGDMDTVRSILKTVWQIDDQEVMSPDQEADGPPRPRELPGDSPNYPTQELLSTLANAYGMNNNIPAAMRMVDFFSREYGVAIPEATWATLFTWTFVLAKPRSGNAAKGGRKIGALPRASLMTLWKTMTADPYFVKPTMSMYNMMIKNLRDCNSPIRIINMMRSAAHLGKRSSHNKRQAWNDFEDCLMKHELDLPTEPLSKARRRWESTAIIQARNRRWMKFWFRCLFKSLVGWHANRFESGTLMNHAVTLRTIPRLLWDWREHVESHIKYDLPTGLLEIKIRSNEEILQRAESDEKQRKERARTMKVAELFVGNELRSSPVHPETGEAEFASKRLRKAREARMREMMEQHAVATTDAPVATVQPES